MINIKLVEHLQSLKEEDLFPSASEKDIERRGAEVKRRQTGYLRPIITALKAVGIPYTRWQEDDNVGCWYVHASMWMKLLREFVPEERNSP